jgi:hypothetical protein
VPTSIGVELSESWQPADMEAPSAAAERSLDVSWRECCESVRFQSPSFYDSLPGEGPPLRHWELAIELAAGPEDSFRSLRAMRPPQSEGCPMPADPSALEHRPETCCASLARWKDAPRPRSSAT